MPLLLLKDLPHYECLLDAAKDFPDLDPSACESFLHLLRTGDEAFRVVSEHLFTHQISQGRFSVLMQLLREEEGCATPTHSPAELADRIGVTRATMTGLIDTLERDGLVKRDPAASDRRMMNVRVTDKGRKLMAEILPGHFQRIAKLMSSLSESERKTLVKLMTKVQSRASSMNFDTATPFETKTGR